MALTSEVTASAWVQITESAGQRVSIRVKPRDAKYTIYYLVATSAPSNAKKVPVNGDNAMIETEQNNWDGVSFQNLGSTQHVYARTELGTVTVFVTTAL